MYGSLLHSMYAGPLGLALKLLGVQQAFFGCPAAFFKLNASRPSSDVPQAFLNSMS